MLKKQHQMTKFRNKLIKALAHNDTHTVEVMTKHNGKHYVSRFTEKHKKRIQILETEYINQIYAKL